MFSRKTTSPGRQTQKPSLFRTFIPGFSKKTPEELFEEEVRAKALFNEFSEINREFLKLQNDSERLMGERVKINTDREKNLADKSQLIRIYHRHTSEGQKNNMARQLKVDAKFEENKKLIETIEKDITSINENIMKNIEKIKKFNSDNKGLYTYIIGLAGNGFTEEEMLEKIKRKIKQRIVASRRTVRIGGRKKTLKRKLLNIKH